MPKGDPFNLGLCDKVSQSHGPTPKRTKCNPSWLLQNLTPLSTFLSQDLGQGTPRCDWKENLLQNGCKLDFIEFPVSSIKVEKNDSLSDTGSGDTVATQMTPQRIKLILRSGRCQMIPIRPEGRVCLWGCWQWKCSLRPLGEPLLPEQNALDSAYWEE